MASLVKTSATDHNADIEFTKESIAIRSVLCLVCTIQLKSLTFNFRNEK